MNMKNWKRMIPLTIALFFVVVMAGSAWAADSLVISSDLSYTRNGSPAAGLTDLTALSDSITWQNAAGNTASAFVVGSTLEVQLPDGLEFIAEDGSAATAGKVDTLVGTGLAGTTAPTVNPSSLITTQYVDVTGAVKNAVTGFRIPILTSGSGDSSITIDFNQAGAANTGDLTIRPIPALTASPMNVAGLKVTAKANGGTSSEITSDVGSISMVLIPKLSKALAVGTNAIDLYFNVDVDQSTVATGTGLAINAAVGGSDFTITGAVGGDTADISVDPSNKKLVHLTNITIAAGDFATDGTSFVNIDTANDSVDNDLKAVPGTATNQNFQVAILPAAAAVESVTVNKTAVGSNVALAAVDDTYTQVLKPDSSNKLVVTFNLPGGLPFDWRIVNTATGEKLDVNLTSGAFTGNGTGFEIDETSFTLGTDLGEVSGTGVLSGANQTSNVVRVEAAANNTGMVQVNVAFDDINAIYLGQGQVGTIQVQASLDNFATHVDSPDISLDRKAPSLVMTGEGAPKALSRTQVQVTFDEEMDRTSVERLFVDINGNGSQNAGEESIYNLRDITAGSDLTVKSVSLASDNKTVTLTTDLIPVGDTLKVQINGQTLGGTVDTANRQGVMDKAGNFVEDSQAAVGWANTATSAINSSTFQVSGETLTSCVITNQATRRDFIADSGILRTTVNGPSNLGTVNIRAVDADDHTKILSTVVSTAAAEVSTGVYRNTTMALTTGITSRAVIVQASTDSTFNTGVIESNEVVIDNTKPKVVSAEYVDANTVKITFDEPVLVAGAENGANYSIAGLQVSNTATLDLTTEKAVTLTTTTMTTGSTYTVDVAAAVQDLAGNGINSSADSVGIDRAQYTAGVDALAVAPTSVTISAGNSATATVSGGVAPYTVAVSGSATATISGNTVTITGSSAGGATVTVSDSASPASTATVDVTVTAAVVEPAPVGQNPKELTGDEIATAPVNMGSVAIGTGNQMQLALNFPAYDAPVDIYVGVMTPNGTLFLLDQDGKLTTDHVAYATGVTDAKTATIFDAFNVCTPFGTPAVPTGTWHAYTVVAQTNGGDIDALDWAADDYNFQYYSFDVSCGE